MQLGAVTFVLTETILREAGTKFPHQTIARDLCDHARGRDAQAHAVAINDRRLRERKRENRQTVDQDVVGRDRQAGDCDSHRLV